MQKKNKNILRKFIYRNDSFIMLVSRSPISLPISVTIDVFNVVSMNAISRRWFLFSIFRFLARFEFTKEKFGFDQLISYSNQNWFYDCENMTRECCHLNETQSTNDVLLSSRQFIFDFALATTPEIKINRMWCNVNGNKTN